MNEIIYYDETFCKIIYNESDDVIIGYWKGYQSIEKGKEAFEAYLKVTEETKCPVIIGDLSKIQGSFTNLNDWIEKDWIIRAISKGHKINAMVYSPDIFSKFAMNDLNNRYKQAKNPPVVLRLFDDLDEAKGWVKTQR